MCQSSMSQLNWFPLLIRLNWIESYNSTKLVLFGDLKNKSNFQFLIPSNYLYSGVLPFTSTWKMVKEAPNNIPMNMVGLDPTSR